MRTMSMAAAAALATAGLLGGAAVAAAQSAPSEKPEQAAQSRTITAQVVDQSCYLAQGLHGADHKMCAEVCAKAGVPLVFLGEDGQLYLPVSSAMPSAGFNEQLVEHAEENVRVTGKVAKKSGANSITVEKIEAAG